MGRTSGAWSAQYSNLSIFDVATTSELHEMLWDLPLFPYMEIDGHAAGLHPSDIAAG